MNSHTLLSVDQIYTVCLLNSMTGIIKSICVKEMIFLLFSFRHRSLVTVHTDLHGHTASGCLCRSCSLQWCLMYLSQLSGCPKVSQRAATSSGISLLGTKSNQKVAKSGEYRGWSSTVTFCWAKNCLTIVALWDGALLCKRNQSLDSHMPGLTRQILFRSLSITPL